MYDERQLALIDADRRPLVRAASRLLGPAEAEDAVQDAYLRALEAGTAPPVFNAAQAWLLTVVRNLAIDRLRRRQWMQQWLAETQGTHDAMPATAPSAENDAALAQQAAHALRQLAATLTPAEGAAVLLHEVFEASHAEIADARGISEASSRQQLRRALLKLQQARGTQEPHPEPEQHEETAFRLYLQSLQLRDPQILWAMLRQPPISALARFSTPSTMAAAAAPTTSCGVVQIGGQLGLVLTLDGVRLCVLPLGVRPEHADEEALA